MPLFMIEVVEVVEMERVAHIAVEHDTRAEAEEHTRRMYADGNKFNDDWLSEDIVSADVRVRAVDAHIAAWRPTSTIMARKRVETPEVPTTERHYIARLRNGTDVSVAVVYDHVTPESIQRALDNREESTAYDACLDKEFPAFVTFVLGEES